VEKLRKGDLWEQAIDVQNPPDKELNDVKLEAKPCPANCDNSKNKTRM
jgi:hypothetical protein